MHDCTWLRDWVQHRAPIEPLVYREAETCPALVSLAVYQNRHGLSGPPHGFKIVYVWKAPQFSTEHRSD